MKYITSPTKIVFGEGSLSRIKDIADGFKGKVMLFTGKSSMHRLGYTDKVVNMLKDREVLVYDKVKPSPSVGLVMEAVELARNENIGLMLGLGGGSVMDTAKCAAAMVKNFEKGKHLSEYADNEEMIPKEGIPFIAIPTTSGTGAEVTRWAVIWDGKKKHTIGSLNTYAKASIIDPELTYSLPKKQTASTGMDALSQAIESYWSRNHNKTSDTFALDAIRLVFEHLEGAYKDPENKEHRRGMSLAALYSGLAINGTKTTACHSVSYPITAYFGVPHGHACALTIPSFMVYNSKAVPDRIKDIAKAMGASTAKEGAEKVRNLMKGVGLETELGKLGIDKNGIEIIVKNGFTPDRVKHNPRDLNSDNLRDILKEIM